MTKNDHEKVAAKDPSPIPREIVGKKDSRNNHETKEREKSPGDKVGRRDLGHKSPKRGRRSPSSSSSASSSSSFGSNSARRGRR